MIQGHNTQWLKSQSKKVLELMGYDINGSVHEQFLEKYKDQLNDPSRVYVPPPKKVKTPTSLQALYSQRHRIKKKLKENLGS